jgi:pyruvate,orthophosphate dikinase
MAKTVSAKPARSVSKTPAARAASTKHVFFFGDGKADGNRTMKYLLGGNGCGLA